MNHLKKYKPRSGYWDDIYRISMTSKNGKKLYLSVKDAWYDKEGKLHRTHEWTWNMSIGIQFKNKEEAEEYAKTYFKNFDKWFVDINNEYQGCI